MLALGGAPARWVDTGEPGGPPYQLRIAGLGTTGLAVRLDDSAVQSVQVALIDDALRVREIALTVVARQELEDALATVDHLGEDPVARGRAAASRACPVCGNPRYRWKQCVPE